MGSPSVIRLAGDAGYHLPFQGRQSNDPLKEFIQIPSAEYGGDGAAVRAVFYRAGEDRLHDAVKFGSVCDIARLDGCLAGYRVQNLVPGALRVRGLAARASEGFMSAGTVRRM